MEKNLKIGILMDFYGGLLTKKQYDAVDLYYNQDYSLGEIAELENISRQGVRDSIKRGEKLLEEFEEKLGLAKRFRNISDLIDQLSDTVQSIPESEAMKSMIENIKNEL